MRGVQVAAEDLRPDDFVATEGDYGDEVVDRVERGFVTTRVWYVGWVIPAMYHPRDMLKVVNR